MIPLPQKQRTQAILVAGMHRSGTSALTKILSILGADLPSNLMPAIKGNNESGFWESRDLERIHDSLLESAGSSWNDWSEFNPDWYESTTAQHYKQQILEYLKEDFDHSPQYVIKDPRICRILPLWLDVAREYDSQPIVIIPFRNPLEVAESLKVRDGMSVSKGLLLWLRHVTDAVHDSQEATRAFISFDSLIKDWQGSIEILSDQTGIKWSKKSILAELQIEDYLDPGQKHQSLDQKILESNKSVPDYVVNVYRSLKLLEKDVNDENAVKTIEHIRVDFNEKSSVYAKVLLHEQLQSNILKNDLNKSSQQFLELEKAHARKDKQINQIQEAHAEKDKLINQLQEAHSEKDKQINQLQEAHAGKDKQINQLQEAHAGKDKQMNQLQEVHAEKDKKINRLQEAHVEKDKQINQLQEAPAEIYKQLAELQQAYNKLNQVNTNAHLELEEERKKVLKFEYQSNERLHNNQSLQEKLTSQTSECLLLNQLLQEREVIFQNLEEKVDQRQVQLEALEEKLCALTQLLEEKESECEQLISAQDALNKESQNVQEFFTHYIEDKNAQLEQAKQLLCIVLKSGKNNNKYQKYLNNKPGNILLYKIEGMFNPKTGRNIFRDRNLILESGLFDPFYYLTNNPDVLGSGVSPLDHFCRYGWKEERNPNAEFDINSYYEANPEAREATINPLVHYLLFKKKS